MSDADVPEIVFRAAHVAGDLFNAGVALWCEGDDLCWSTRRRPSDEHLRLIAEHADGLVRILRGPVCSLPVPRDYHPWIGWANWPGNRRRPVA